VRRHEFAKFFVRELGKCSVAVTDASEVKKKFFVLEKKNMPPAKKKKKPKPEVAQIKGERKEQGEKKGDGDCC
jgi:hypothetical protein